MRLWTVHPRYLDAKGLVAACREALLAQKVLRGATRGYRNHPQLTRFKAQPRPSAAIAAYLTTLLEDAKRRGYHFDGSKIPRHRFRGEIAETTGQLLYEWKHLRAKLRRRAPLVARQWRAVAKPASHPIFRIVAGGIRAWEKRSDGAKQ